MKKRMFSIPLLVLLIVILSGCNLGARRLGGTQTIELQPGQKLENVTWKDSNLWILSRRMKEGETPEEWTFQESSSMGILEGTVILKEIQAAPLPKTNP